jgi:hypothetical protein
MTRIVLGIADDGTVLRPNLHDGEVTGVLLDGSQDVVVLVSDVDGQKYELRLKGVKTFRVDNFAPQNIILDVTVEGSSATTEDVSDACGVVAGSNQAERLAERLFEKYAPLLSSGELRLVRLNPSSGCALVCICAAIDCDSL